MNSITKWLTDPDAANYPFPFQIGDRLKSSNNNTRGTVRNAKYAGPTSRGPSWLAHYINDAPFWITYYLETEKGEIAQLPLSELENIHEKVRQDTNC